MYDPSQTFDKTGKSKIGLLLFRQFMVSILGRGVASANFQVEGNLQVPIEVLIAEVITGGRIGADL